MSGSTAERIARLEHGADTQKAITEDHTQRLRKIERLVYGVIGAAAIFSWTLTQANTLAKMVN